MTGYKPTQLVLDWEKALRNPELEQTTGALCKVADGQRSYCCLGVLQEVAGNVARPDPMGNTNNWKYYGETAWGESGLPALALTRRVTGEEGDPDEDMFEGNVLLGVDSYGIPMEAAELNDDYYWTFEMIADQVRKIYIEGTGNHRDYTITSDELYYLEDEDDCE